MALSTAQGSLVEKESAWAKNNNSCPWNLHRNSTCLIHDPWSLEVGTAGEHGFSEMSVQ
jgi:hypothetical protein